MMTYQGAIGRVLSTEVLVVGGGPSGFAAAIAAAECGAQTLLIEQTGMLGGMATAGLVGPFMTCYDGPGERQLIQGVFDRLAARIDAMGGGLHPSKVGEHDAYSGFHSKGHAHCTPFDSETLKRAMDDMCAEAGVKVLLHTTYIDSVLQDGRISRIIAHNKDGLTAIDANVFVDCTGDADVAARSGADTVKGNEDKNHAISPATLMFELCDVDGDRFKAYMAENRHRIGLPFQGPLSWLCAKGRESGEWTVPRSEMCLFETPNHSVWKANVTRVAVDATDAADLSRAEAEGRRQVAAAHAFIRKYVPGFERSTLTASASTMGVRETRHLRGEYLLTVDDLVKGTLFDDRIALSSNSIDIHDPNGVGGQYIPLKTDRYAIPYRSLVTRKVKNLLVGGRAISATSDAAAAFRVMPPCFAIGQAAGAAAALCAADDIDPVDLDPAHLKAALIAGGAVL